LPDLGVRLATIEDAEDVAAVLGDAFESYRPLYTPAAFGATTPSADEVRQRWHEGPVWVAVLDGCIVGTVAAVPRGDVLYMRSMAVRTGSRGAGCGRRLVEEVERYAAACGQAAVVLSTTPFLSEAIALYEHCGFRRTAAGPSELAGTPLFTMEKKLE
jgi:GNAT superfamily N-acetyltransferase